MSLLAALVLAAAAARVESVSLTTLDSRLAVRVLVSGTPGLVAVHREGDVARVSIMDADLGLRFAGGRRFSWTPSDGFDPALLAATPAKLDRLEIAAGASEVSVLLHVPPEVSVDVRRDSRGLLLVFRGPGRRSPSASPSRAGAVRPRPSRHRATAARLPRPRPSSRAPAPARPRPRRRPSSPRPRPPRRRPPPADTADLAKRLFPDRARRSPGRDDRAGVRAVPAPLPDRRAPRRNRRRRCRRPRSSSRGRRRASRWAPSACAPRWTRAT